MSRTGHYSLGEIYKLVSDQTEKIYIGRTCQSLSCKRMAQHKCLFQKWANRDTHYITSFQVFAYEDCQIILIESFPCKDKHELEARERHHIESLKCVNKYVPTRGYIDYYKAKCEGIKARVKTYASESKAKITDKHKNYYLKNLDKLREYQKERMHIHGEQIRAREQRYRENNREAIRERHKVKITCEICKIEVSKTNIRRHQQSQTCKSILQVKEEEPEQDVHG